ncbi:MFS transporter (plasmid) [Deinococcus aquaticus]|uniref:MFS transporter n=1 Tax=Deinococcus aquaticus TaxID=328692 RepID=A0ABY7V4S3_9DEIO|nr:MFS transporter [Deinococcus aquaticus]WDA60209.1 MFS transporter [Deinococcus aquaticus]
MTPPTALATPLPPAPVPSAPSALGQAAALSAAGQQLGGLSLPVIASTLPGSTALTLGLITAAAFLPHLLLGLLLGAAADRLPPRAAMLGMNVARGALLLGAAGLAHAGALSAPLLAGMALLLGSLGALHDASTQRWLAHFEDRRDANRAVQAGEQAALAAAPGLSGLLIAQAGAAAALLGESLSFLAASLRLLGLRAPVLAGRDGRGTLFGDAARGMAFVWRHGLLRRLAVTAAFVNFARAMTFTLLSFHLLRVWQVAPVVMGLTLTVGGLGGLVGASLSRRLSGMPDDRVMRGGLLALAGAGLLVPLAAPGALGLALIMLGRAAGTACVVTYNIRQDALRQSLSPAGMEARVATASRTLLWGSLPLGAALGGWLGTVMGTQEALTAAALLVFAAPLLLGRAPVQGAPAPTGQPGTA